MIRYLCIIQARLTSTRFPNKVMETISGQTLVKRVFMAAYRTPAIDKVIVAWPERYPDLDQNDVRERFRRISREFPSHYIIRLTADCPLLTSAIIEEAIQKFESRGCNYYCNRETYPDGFDVQIFTPFRLHGHFDTNREHVINPEKYKTKNKFLSVDTKADLERVRKYAK